MVALPKEHLTICKCPSSLGLSVKFLLTCKKWVFVSKSAVQWEM